MSSEQHPRRRGEALRTLVVVVVTVIVTLLVAVTMTPGLSTGELVSRLGLGRHPLGDAPAVQGSGSYRFLAHQRGRPAVPVAYDPCREIHVEVNPEGGPPTAVGLVRDALRQVSRATGLKLVYDGVSERRPRWSSPTRPLGLGRTDPVLVSFATADEVPELVGRVAGVGGSTSVESDLGGRRYVTGQVTLDSDTFRVLSRDPEDVVHERAIVLHELGHLVGLAHVDDPRELMYAENLGRTTFGTGDRLGLAELGRGRCF